MLLGNTLRPPAWRALSLFIDTAAWPRNHATAPHHGRASAGRLALSCAAVPSLCSSINCYQTDRQRKRDVPLILVRPLVSQRRPGFALCVGRTRNRGHSCTAVLAGLLLLLLSILLLGRTRLWNVNDSSDTYRKVGPTLATTDDHVVDPCHATKQLLVPEIFSLKDADIAT